MTGIVGLIIGLGIGVFAGYQAAVHKMWYAILETWRERDIRMKLEGDSPVDLDV
jgi:hypothetical protein